MYFYTWVALLIAPILWYAFIWSFSYHHNGNRVSRKDNKDKGILHGKNMTKTIHATGMRYLNRFLSLDSAPLLMSHDLWPKSNRCKEICESVAMLDILLKQFKKELKPSKDEERNWHLFDPSCAGNGYAIQKVLETKGQVYNGQSLEDFYGPDFNEMYDACVAARTVILVVGDGTTPRTGALLACTIKQSNVISVDPILKEKWTQSCEPFQRLEASKSTIEEWIKNQKKNHVGRWQSVEQVFIVAVHSHAKPASFLSEAMNLFPKADVHFITMPCCVPQDLSAPHILLSDQQLTRDIPSPQNRVLVYRCIRN